MSYPPQNSSKPLGYHIVGSLPTSLTLYSSARSTPISSSLSSSSSRAAAALTTLLTFLPHHLLKRLPDLSSPYISSQCTPSTLVRQCLAMNLPEYLPQCILTPHVYNPQNPNHRVSPSQSLSNQDSALAKSYLIHAHPGPDLDLNHIASSAFASYSTFSTLLSHGHIRPTTRLQINLPTPLALTATAIQPSFQPVVEPLLEAAIFRTIDILSSSLPREKLAIQFNISVELDLLRSQCEDFCENDGNNSGNKPWWTGGVPAGILTRLFRLIEHVDEEVEVGLSFFCPTSINDLEDMTNMVRLAKTLLLGSARYVEYLCILLSPPSAAVEREVEEVILEPLKELMPHLAQSGTEMYLGLGLGLAKPFDETETKRQVKLVQRVLGTDVNFGIAFSA